MFPLLPLTHVFLDREKEASQLLDKIRDRRRLPYLVAITGKPGIGKTALARIFLEGLRHEFKPIWLPRYVREREGDDLFDLVLKEVRKSKRNALVVVDDADPLDEANERFVRQLVGIKKVYAVLVTVRQITRSTFHIDRLELSPLTPALASDLLREEINVQDARSVSDEDIDMFVAKAEGNPAVLYQIAESLTHQTVDQIKLKLGEGLNADEHG